MYSPELEKGHTRTRSGTVHVRDWTAFVRSQLAVDRLTPERDARLVREIASQLEDFYQDALARGASEEAADAYARQQISDWTMLERDLVQADPRHERPRLERFTDRIQPRRRGGEEPWACLPTS